jgi:hypothetical protein
MWTQFITSKLEPSREIELGLLPMDLMDGVPAKIYQFPARAKKIVPLNIYKHNAQRNSRPMPQRQLLIRPPL